MEVRKHTKSGYLCREDGAVFCGKKWTYGHPDNKGWMLVGHKSWRVARLIAECFIPNPEGKPTVDHINRIRTDNRVENLRWATQREQNLNRDTAFYSTAEYRAKMSDAAKKKYGYFPVKEQ